MADKPFSQYLAEAKNRRGATTPRPAAASASKPVETSGPAYGFGGKGSDKPADVLSTVFDILSRPLFSQTERVDSFLDTQQHVGEKLRAGDQLGAVGEGVMGVVDQLTGAGVRGLFSTDRADKRSTSELIEKGTDRVGADFNPEYVDTQDNVNPVLKGVAGFAGDVLGDPLTYVPGAAFVSVGKKLGTIAKGGAAATRRASEAVSELVDARRGEQAASRVLDERVDMPDAPPAATAGRAAEPIETAVDEIPVTSGERAVDNALEGTAAPKVRPADPATLPKVTELVAQSPKAAKASEFLATISPRAAADIAKAGHTLSDFPAPKDYQRVVLDAMAEAPEGSAIPQVKIGPKQYMPLDQAFAASVNNTAVRKAVAKHYEEHAAEYREAAEAGTPIDVLGNPVTPETAAVSAATDVLNRHEMYTLMKDSQRERVETALGAPLRQYMGSLGDTKFQEVADRVHAILKGEAPEIDDIIDNAKLSHAEKRLFSHLGIDVAETNTARLGSASRVREPGGVTPESTLARINGGAPLSREDQQLIETIQDVFGSKLDNASYTTRTKGGVLRTKQGYGEGLGKRERELNTMDQMGLYTRIVKNVTKDIGDGNEAMRAAERAGDVVAGERRASMIRQRVVEDMSKASAVLWDQGIPMWMGVGKDERVLLTLDQMVLDLFATAGSSNRQRTLSAALFNGETSAPITNIMEAVVAAQKNPGITADEIAQLLQNTAKRNGKTGELRNGISKDGVFGHRVGEAGPRPSRDANWEPNVDARGKTVGWYRVDRGDNRLAEVSALIAEAGPRIASRIAENNADWVAKMQSEALDLTDEQLAKLSVLIENPERLGDALRAVSQRDKDIIADAGEGGAMDVSQMMAQEAVDAALPAGVPSAARAATDTVTAAGRATAAAERLLPGATDDAVAEATRPISQDMLDEAAESARLEEAGYDLPAGFREETVDASKRFSIDAYRGIQAGVMSKLDPLNKFFNPKYGHARLYQMRHSMGVLASDKIGRFHTRLRELDKQFGTLADESGTRTLSVAWNAVRYGSTPADPTTRAAAEQLKLIAGDLFDLTGREPLIGNGLLRGGAGISAVNEAMATKGLTFEFALDAAKDVSRREGISITEAAARQWREWDVEDPTDFLSRIHDAMFTVAVDQSVAASFMRMGRANGLVSETAKPGFVRFATSKGGRTRYVRHLPSELYVDKSYAGELHALEQVANQSRQIDGEIGRFINSYYTPVQNAWKYGITLPRPGHHIRNMVGDMSMTFVAEGTKKFRQSSRDAFRVLGLRNNYDDVDVLASIRNYGNPVMPTGGEVLSKGKYGQLTNEQVYEAAQRHGLLPSYHVGEDYLDNIVEAGVIQRAADAVTLRGGKIEKALGGISQYRDHYARLQHFLQHIYKGQEAGGYKNMDDLIEKAAVAVKKYHPDGSMTTASEAKYLKLVIPFYSWLRGALPAILESTLTQPGRVTAFSKASYNAAVAMGVNPDTLYDPFPTNGLFPSFLTEQALGPQAKIGGRYFSMNPGIAHVDVMNMLGPDPVRGIAGSVSPLLRAPAELLSGGSWSTGAPIKDSSDYVDSSLPGVNYVSNITGNSVTGSILSLLQGKGLDPQYQQAAGNKGPLDQALSASNWLTGFGVQNLSKDNYTNYAEIEKRNREGEK